MNDTRIAIESYRMLQFCFRITYRSIRCPALNFHSNVARIGRSFLNLIPYFIFYCFLPDLFSLIFLHSRSPEFPTE